MGMKMKASPDIWYMRQKIMVRKSTFEAEIGDVIERDRGHGEAEGDHPAGIDLGGEHAGDGEQQHQHESRRRQHFAGLLRGVAHHQLQELRDQHGGSEEHASQHEVEENRGREIAVLQQLQLQDGMGVPPFVNDQPTSATAAMSEEDW